MGCSHLIPGTKISAFYSTTQKTLTVSAEVTLRPNDYGAEICRNVLEPVVTPVPSFVIAAPAPRGIQPDYIAVRRISHSFAFDKAPATIAVYSAGVDAPARTEISVGDVPPAHPPLPAPGAPKPLAEEPKDNVSAPRTVTGWSTAFNYDEALADAVQQLSGPLGIMNPDVGADAMVVESGVAIGGYRAKRGLYVTLRTR